MMFVIWSPWWRGSWVIAYSVHIAQAEKLKEASDEGDEKKCFVFPPFTLEFTVARIESPNDNIVECLPLRARSLWFLFLPLFVSLSHFFFFDIGSFHRVYCFAYIFFAADFFPGMWFSIQATCVAVVTMIVMWTSHTEANIPTNCVYMVESRSKGFFSWTPHFGASRCNLKRDSIEWSLTQNWRKKMYEADICVSTAYTAPRTSSSLILFALPKPMRTGIADEIGGERNAME